MKPNQVLLALLFTILSTCFSGNLSAQTSTRDTLDGHLDLSAFLLTAKGFIPVPMIITEPALGNIGLAITPVFIKPNKHQIEGEYTPPSITAGMAGYTANNSWLVGAFRSASIPQWGMKYRVGGGYANVNISLYRNIPLLGETEFPFQYKMVPIFGSITKRIGKSNVYAGLSYMYLNSTISTNFDNANLPDFIEEGSLSTTQSIPGVLVEYDGRNSVLTPDKGFLLRGELKASAEWTGSDFTYQNLHLTSLSYFQVRSNWVSAFRLEYIQQFGNAPFFLEPGVNMRGVPAQRYQGTTIGILETEQRYDFNLRWSGVAFGGTAKALRSGDSFEDSEYIYNFGVGFRYLLARMFKLRVGVDVAASNDAFGYYIVFGSNWN